MVRTFSPTHDRPIQTSKINLLPFSAQRLSRSTLKVLRNIFSRHRNRTFQPDFLTTERRRCEDKHHVPIMVASIHQTPTFGFQIYTLKKDVICIHEFHSIYYESAVRGVQ